MWPSGLFVHGRRLTGRCCYVSAACRSWHVRCCATYGAERIRASADVQSHMAHGKGCVRGSPGPTAFCPAVLQWERAVAVQALRGLWPCR